MPKTIAQTARQKAQKALQNTSFKLRVKEVNVIESMAAGTAIVSGLSHAKINELLSFKNGVIGMVHSLSNEGAGVIFLTNADSLKAGDQATQTHQVLDIPVGSELLGRVINPLG